MLSFASPFFGDWTKHQNYSLGNTGSQNEINYANQFVQSAINGSMHNIIDNAQFLGSFVTATGDMISAPYTMGIKKDFSLEGLFQNTNTLLHTTSLGREWIGQQFPKANNVIGHMGYHIGYLATEAAIMVGTLGTSATKHATRILEFSHKTLFTPVENLLKKRSIVPENITILDSQSILHRKISGFTYHGVNRAIEREIRPQDIFDAINSPLKIYPPKADQYGRYSQRLVGKKAEVVINPDSRKIISVNPTSSNKRNLLTKERP